MIDRAVEHPNRYRLVPVLGEDDNIVDLIPEPGEVLEEGTPLCKATLLQDITAKALGLPTGVDPTVNDAFLAAFMLAKDGRIIRLHVTCGGKPAKAGIPISGATKLDGSPLVTDGTDTLLALTVGTATTLATPAYLDMAPGSIVVNTPGNSIVDVNWALPVPAVGTKVFSTTTTFMFSPYAATYDVCAVGGGGGGCNGNSSGWATWTGSGGGGGYVTNKLNIAAVANSPYTATVGAGGTERQPGGTSSLKLGAAVVASADGGKPGYSVEHSTYNIKCYGGEGNGKGGDHGEPGSPGTVRRFGDADGVQYGGGGAGGDWSSVQPGGAPYGGAGASGGETDDADATYSQGGRGPGGGGGGGGVTRSPIYNQDGAAGYRGEVAVRWRVSV